MTVALLFFFFFPPGPQKAQIIDFKGRFNSVMVITPITQY